MTDELHLALNWGREGLAGVAQDRPDAWHEFSGGGLPCPVRVRVDVDEQGRAVCTGVLLVGDQEVTSRTLRAVPLRRLMTYFAGDKPAARDLPDGETTFEQATAAMVAELVALGATDGVAPTGRNASKPGRPRLTDQELIDFMRTYNLARTDRLQPGEATSGRPVAAVAEHRRMSRAAAHRWLRTARERGITGGEGDR